VCSVVGYIGKNYSRSFVLQGLARLEYRGYDSAGFACLTPDNHQLVYAKAAGRLDNLVKKVELSPIDGFVSIGHTRWSTHGLTSESNAHPQFDCKKQLSIVHNGIIENHHDLRVSLEQAGHVFTSETDTEVIAHLFESVITSHPTYKAAIVDLVGRLEGAFAFIGIAEQYPDNMVLVRKRSPLCIGIGEGEMFVASDLLAFAGKTKKVVFLPDESFAILTKDMIELYDFSGKVLPVLIQELEVDWVDQEKKGYEHFMLKEIYEQKSAIYATVKHLNFLSVTIWDHLGITAEQAKNLNVINFIGSGTSWHAARIAEFFFQEICGIRTRVHLASEFRCTKFFPDNNALYIFISQSGETADTLEAMRLIKSHGLTTIGLTNVASSTLVREADSYLLTQAGHEIAVASTKAFSTQLTALYWFANRLALERGTLNELQVLKAQEDLLMAAEILENAIEEYKVPIKTTLAKRYATYKKSIFLGRHVSYPFAMEAALKLKEISYIFAQCYPAGELKHGPLALVDSETPIFIFSHQDPIIYQKLLSNAQEAKARGGHIVVFAFRSQVELIGLADCAFVLPCINPLLGPLSMTGLVQFFVYEIAKELGCPIDKPRNLAKSVTVE